MRLSTPAIALSATAVVLGTGALLGGPEALSGADDPTGAATTSTAARTVNAETATPTAPLPAAAAPPAGVPRSVEDMTPDAADYPLARPRPTKEQADALAGAPIDLLGMRRTADELPTMSGERTVGETGGEPYVDYVWGDVENYQSGQQAFAADDIAVRIIRRVGVGHEREFLIVSFSAKTGRTAHSRASSTDGGDRPDSYTYDMPDTAWAD
jgi:hypothetical protein